MDSNTRVRTAGHLYTWGTGDQGELGLGPDERTRGVPTLLDTAGAQTWRSIATSVHFTGAVTGMAFALLASSNIVLTCLVTDLGELYVFGSRLIGVSSTATSPVILSIPRRFAVMSELYVLNVQAGTSHALAYVGTAYNSSHDQPAKTGSVGPGNPNCCYYTWSFTYFHT